MDVIEEEMLANMEAKVDSNQEKMDAWIEMRAWQKETAACQEATEACQRVRSQPHWS
jgi:hypothetical protein